MVTHQFCTFFYKPFRKSQEEILFSHFMKVKTEVQDTRVRLQDSLEAAQLRVHVRIFIKGEMNIEGKILKCANSS